MNGRSGAIAQTIEYKCELEAAMAEFVQETYADAIVKW